MRLSVDYFVKNERVMKVNGSDEMLQLADGVCYHIQMSGIGEPTLLLHGFTGGSSSWRLLVTTNLASFQFIAPSLLGHGKTDVPDQLERYDIFQAARDLAEILHLKDISKVNVIGYSMGGRLALAFALCYPDRVKRLVLESTSAGLEREDRRVARRADDQRLAEQILLTGVEAFVDDWEQIPLFDSQQKNLTAAQWQVQRAERLSHSAQGLANALLGMGTGVQPYLFGRLSALEIPVLLITGALDQKFQQLATEMARQLPNGRHTQVADCGHAVHLEQPEKFGKIVVAFLQENER